MHAVWAEINLSALEQNYQQLLKLAKAQMKNARGVMPVIKADAYGHGLVAVAHVLKSVDCRMVGVSNVLEAKLLRALGYAHQILLFESNFPSDAALVASLKLTPTVCSTDFANALNEAAAKAGEQIPIHIKVDTGMGRLGLLQDDVITFVSDLRRTCPNLVLEGIYTHFPVADSNRQFTIEQMRTFRDIVFSLQNKHIEFEYVHASNSMGLLDYPSTLFNIARPGLMLYGLYPSLELKDKIKLSPLMTVKSRVLFIKSIKKGQGISYGHTFIAPQDMTVAVLSVGYSNGYLRSLSNKAAVLIGGKRCPLLGRVTMDQVMVDISVPFAAKSSVEVGDEVVLMGHQANEFISADELASWAGTISYEICCSLGSRIPKVYHAPARETQRFLHELVAKSA